MTMKNNKGKVYPSPSSSVFPAAGDALSVLQLLPAAILTLAAVLSLEERQVLAYMITRSIKSTNPSCSSSLTNKRKSSNSHNTPLFDCDCFDCYTSYWFKWDSSPNRELIHQAIEAFEDHLNNNGEMSKKRGGGRKRDKMVHSRLAGNPHIPQSEVQGTVVQTLREYDISKVEVQAMLPEYDISKAEVQAEGGGLEVEMKEGYEDSVMDDAVLVDAAEAPPPEAVSIVMRTAAANHHKGLARKVLPDVLGLLNSRLWNLWSPHA